MKKLAFLLTVVALVLLTAFPAGVAQAQATSQTWTSSITYYTPSTSAGAALDVYYYANASATNYHYGPITLGAHQAGSLYIGATSVPDGFAGAAVLSANVPVIATYVQFVADAGLRNSFGRMLYSAFDPSQAATPFYVPTVLNARFGSTSQVGVQNVGTSQITANLNFYPKGVVTPTVVTKTIDPQASIVFRPGDAGYGLPTNWEGSLVIDATGPVVAAAEETYDSGPQAYAFEGVSTGSNTLYFPSMLCHAFGTQDQISYYAIQNASTTADATVTATFYDTNGSPIGTGIPATVITKGGKTSFNPCDFGVPSGTSGSAKFESTGAPILGIGKVNTGDGMRTAFVGQSAGFLQVAAPYIRWATDNYVEFRSYIAIMNVGGGNATNIVATYYDAAGNAYVHNVATAGSPLAPFTKRNSLPSDAAGIPANFGVSPTGGAVEITSDQPIVVVVRSQRLLNPTIGTIAKFGEDYNAVDITP